MMKSGPRGGLRGAWVSVAVLNIDKRSSRNTFSLSATRLVMRVPCMDCDGKASSPHDECGSIERSAWMGEACARCATAVRGRAARLRVRDVRTIARRRVAVVSLPASARAKRRLQGPFVLCSGSQRALRARHFKAGKRWLSASGAMERSRSELSGAMRATYRAQRTAEERSCK